MPFRRHVLSRAVDHPLSGRNPLVFKGEKMKEVHFALDSFLHHDNSDFVDYRLE